MCKRELTVDDVRNNVCKRCETKPANLEYCVKLSPPFIECQSCRKHNPVPFQ